MDNFEADCENLVLRACSGCAEGRHLRVAVGVLPEEVLLEVEAMDLEPSQFMFSRVSERFSSSTLSPEDAKTYHRRYVRRRAKNPEWREARNRRQREYYHRKKRAAEAMRAEGE